MNKQLNYKVATSSPELMKLLPGWEPLF